MDWQTDGNKYFADETNAPQMSSFGRCMGHLETGKISDARLKEAAEQAQREGSERPLMLQQLRDKIQLERLKEGKGELTVEFEEPKEYELTEEEKRKQEKRKIKNREAAKKSRMRRKAHESELQKKNKSLKKTNDKLRADLNKLYDLTGRYQQAVHTARNCCHTHTHTRTHTHAPSSSSSPFPSLQILPRQLVSGDPPRQSRHKKNVVIRAARAPPLLSNGGQFNIRNNVLVSMKNSRDFRGPAPFTSCPGQEVRRTLAGTGGVVVPGATVVVPSRSPSPDSDILSDCAGSPPRVIPSPADSDQEMKDVSGMPVLTIAPEDVSDFLSLTGGFRGSPAPPVLRRMEDDCPPVPQDTSFLQMLADANGEMPWEMGGASPVMGGESPDGTYYPGPVHALYKPSSLPGGGGVAPRGVSSPSASSADKLTPLLSSPLLSTIFGTLQAPTRGP
ncbi:uncharacterized protein LOC143292373 [Babylonia areolata]|uniref:uncharacterized protein LOC143292373 n=1 Tax=Babylonia areolata TaxID=304850 RepID=UPI003FD2424E